MIVYTRLPDGKVALRFKRPFSDGPQAVVFTPVGASRAPDRLTGASRHDGSSRCRGRRIDFAPRLSLRGSDQVPAGPRHSGIPIRTLHPGRKDALLGLST
jgi:hypothetical protein